MEHEPDPDRRTPRQTLEYRALRAMPRISVAAAALVVTLLGYLAWGAWNAGTQSEQLRTAISATQEMRRSVDALREQMPTTRDMEGIQRMLSDHEARLRELERRTVGMK